MGLFGPPNVEKMKAKKDVNGLSVILANHREDNLRLAAAEALIELGTISVVPLVAMVRRGNGDGFVLQTLIDVGGPSFVNAIIDELKDSHEDKLITTAKLLEKLSGTADRPAISAQKEGAKKAPARPVSVPAAPPPRSIKSLISDLTHGDAEARRETIKLLAAKGSAAIEPLIYALESEDIELSAAAKTVLLKIGKPALGPLAMTFKENGSLMTEQAFTAIGGPAVAPVIAIIKEKKYWMPVNDEIARLIANLTNVDEYERIIAADQLYKLGYYSLEPIRASITAAIQNNRGPARLEIMQKLVSDTSMAFLIESLKQIPSYSIDLAQEVCSFLGQYDVKYLKMLEDQAPGFKQAIEQINHEEIESRDQEYESRTSSISI